MRNQKLTELLRGRQVRYDSSGSARLILDFADRSQLDVEVCGAVATAEAVGGLVDDVWQQQTTLTLGFAGGKTLEMELADSATSVKVWDGKQVLVYLGGAAAETWRLLTYAEYAAVVREAQAGEWRSSFEGRMKQVDALIGYLQEPDQPHRISEWFTVLLDSLRITRHYLRRGRELGVSTDADRRRWERAQQLTQQGVHENLAWAQETMQREFADLVERYRSGSWKEALGKGYRHEFWFDMDRRDKIQAHLEAPSWLHPDLVPDPQLVQVIEATDARLREEGPLLWNVDPPTRIDPEGRLRWNGREDWWWWLDQGDGVAAAPGSST